MLKDFLMIFLIVAVALAVVCMFVVIVDLAIDRKHKKALEEGELSDEEYENRYPLNTFRSAFKLKDADGAVYLNAELLPLREGQEGKPAVGYYCFQDCERCAFVDECENSKV